MTPDPTSDLIDARPPSWHTRETTEFWAPTDGERLRLLVLHWDSYPTARAVYREELPRRGHRVSWLERGPLGLDRAVEEQSPGLRTTLLPFRASMGRSGSWPSRLRGALRKRVDRLRRWKRTWEESGRGPYDVIQARDLVELGLLAWICARLRGAAFGFQLDFPHPEGHLNRTDGSGRLFDHLKRLEWRLLIRIRDELMRRADLVFVISEDMRQRYLAKGLAPERVHVFPVGVGPEFREASGQRERVRDRLGAGDAPVVAYIGSLGAARNIDLFCDILVGIHQQNPAVRFLVLGKDMEATRRRIEELGLGAALLHFGTVAHEQVPAYLAAADVGIFPIDVNTPRGVYAVSSPLKVAEYMASATATVTAPLPEASQLVRDGRCGIVVEDNSVRGFVEAVDSLCRDLRKAHELGENGRDYIYRYKSFEELGHLVEQAYYHLRQRRSHESRSDARRRKTP